MGFSFASGDAVNLRPRNDRMQSIEIIDILIRLSFFRRSQLDLSVISTTCRENYDMTLDFFNRDKLFSWTARKRPKIVTNPGP